MPEQNTPQPNLVRPRAPEPARAPHALLQLLHLDHVGRVNALDNELRDPVALLHLVVGVGVVEQQHFDGAAVVGVDDSRARVDEVLGCEAGAGGDAAVCLFLGCLSVFGLGGWPTGRLGEERCLGSGLDERGTYRSPPGETC